MSESSDHFSRDDSRSSIFLAIECLRCGHYSERPLAWLREANTMACDNCAFSIDLSSGTNRTVIDSHVALSERLDSEFGHR